MSYVFANKALDIDAFQSNLFKTGLFSDSAANTLAYFILIMELGSIILLLTNKILGLKVLFYMFIVFTLYISILKFLNKYEVCGCGGVLNGLSYEKHLIINISLIIISFFSLKLNFITKKI